MRVTYKRTSRIIINVQIHNTFWRCLWCNGYHCRKWTYQLKFKSLARLLAFCISLIPWERYEYSYSFSLSDFNYMATSVEEGKLWIQTRKKLRLKTNLTFHPADVEL